MFRATGAPTLTITQTPKTTGVLDSENTHSALTVGAVFLKGSCPKSHAAEKCSVHRVSFAVNWDRKRQHGRQKRVRPKTRGGGGGGGDGGRRRRRWVAAAAVGGAGQTGSCVHLALSEAFAHPVVCTRRIEVSRPWRGVFEISVWRRKLNAEKERLAVSNTC